MSDHNQPQDTTSSEAFLEDFTVLGKAAYEAVQLTTDTLSQKYNLHPNQVTRMLIAAVVATGIDKDCTETDVINFNLALFHTIIKQWKMMAEPGQERFPMAPVYPEARVPSDLSPEEMFKASNELHAIGEAIQSITLTILDVFSNKHNVCAFDTFITVLGNMITSAFLEESATEDSYQQKVDYLHQAMLAAWDKNKQAEKTKALPN